MTTQAGPGDLSSLDGVAWLTAGEDAVIVPDASLLLGGEYGRAGDDLLIRDGAPDGEGGGLVVQGYFALEAPPPLIAGDQAMIRPELVAKLAGPRAAGQYAQAGPVSEAPPIGQVEDVTGSARVVRLGVPVELAPGDPVYQNDIVETGLASELAIGFADGTIFSLSANARMVLDSMIYDPAGSSNDLTVSVLQGVFSFVTGLIAPTGEMRVETPVATLGIRGTTVHGILQSIAGPLTVFLGTSQQGSVARAVLLDPLSGALIGSVSGLTTAYILGGLGAPLLQRLQSAPEQQFLLQRSGAIHGVQSEFQFRYDTGQPIDQPGDVIQTRAGPNQASGGIGFDRASGPGEALQGDLLSGLESSPTLTLLDGLPFSLLAFDSRTDLFTSAAIAARVELAEASAEVAEGVVSSGQIIFPGGSTPVQSFALVDLSFMSGGTPLPLTTGGVPVTLSLNGMEAQGFAAGVPVFRFQLNPDGSFTFSLFRPLDHPIAGATGAADTIEIGFDVVVSFIDGTELNTTVLSVVLDSGPVAASETGAVDEASALGVPVVGQLPILAGNDGLKSVEFVDQATPLTFAGQPVGLARVSNDTFLGLTGDGTQVFRMVFDTATGAYSFTLLQPVDQPGQGADSLDLVFWVAITDGDNDSVISTITITAVDAVPTTGANAPVTLQESALQGGSGGGTTAAAGVLSFVAGADGARIVALELGGQAGVLQGNELVISGAFFELRVDTLSGAYVYTLTGNTLAHVAGDPLVQSFAYTVQDGDGDLAIGQLEVRVDDDGPVARDDGNAVAEGDSDGDGALNQVSGNVILGADAGSADSPGADGPLRVSEVSFAGLVVAVPSDNSDVAIAGDFGTLTIRSDGTYTYTAPPLGTIQADRTETFGYGVADGDGDQAAAALTIDLIDSEDRLGAFLVTDTNQDGQSLRIVVTRDDAEILASSETARPQIGQESAVALGSDGILLDPGATYALILKFESPQGSVTVTDFDLIFDLNAPVLDAPSNVFLSVLDQGAIQLGTQGGGADGVIWQVEGSPLGVGPPILYDIMRVPNLDDLVVFDSQAPDTSFTLDLRLLPTDGNLPGGADPGTALFGDIEALEISGSQASEVNTLVIRAQDILDIGSAGVFMAVLGDNDTVIVADRQNWLDGDLSTAELDPVRTGQTLVGTAETFDVYQTLAGAEFFVDDDLIVQSQLAAGIV